MRNTNPLLLALALLAPAAAKAQIPRDNPLVEAAHGIAATGLGTSAQTDKADSTFKPTGGRIYVKEFASKMANDPAKVVQIEAGIEAVMGIYEKAVKKAGQANDPATALAFSVAELYAYDRRKEIDPAAFQALVPRFRAVLAKVEATDRQKQEFYEYALSSAGSVMTLASVAEDDGAKARTKIIAETLLEALTGAKPDGIVLDGANVRIETPAAEAPAPAAQGSTSVVGEWRWTSTGSITNWNTTTGAYAGAGRGMTKRYAFAKDGTFKQDALIQVNNSGHTTVAYITAEGRYELHVNNIKFTILKGHVHGEDSIVSSGNYDRPMPESTMRSISETLRYEVRKVDGKLAFVLHLGTDAKSDMVFTTLAKR